MARLLPERCSALRTAPDAHPIAFRLGQIDALARTLLASPALYPAEMRDSLSLRWLVRAWDQYRTDRAISLGPQLIGAECAAERNAFLTLLDRALPTRDHPLAEAIRTVRTLAIRPLASEAAEAAAIVADSWTDLDAVLAVLADSTLPTAPLERLLALVERFRTSHGLDDDALSATARTPCWAVNLAAVARGPAFRLSQTPLPFPGLVQRRLFRADLPTEARRTDAAETLREALHDTACDIARILRAAELFAREFPHQRSHSRLYPAWMLLFALGALTPAQLARALPATKAGAAKLLRQLEARHMADCPGAFAPFSCTITLPVAFPELWDVDPC